MVLKKFTALVLAVTAGSAVGLAAGAGARPASQTAVTTSAPMALRAEDLGYTARMGPVQTLDKTRPGVVNFHVYLSGTDAAAWGRVSGEQTMFIDKVRLLKAQTEDGASHTLRSGPWPDPFPPSLHFYEMDLGGAQHHLTALEFEATVVKVTEWRTITAKKEAPDAEAKNGDPVDCGAFQICLGGTADKFHVMAAAMGDFDASRKAYAAKVPLGFLHHGYAMSAMEVRDGNGKVASGGSGVGTGGAGVQYFSWLEIATTTLPDRPDQITVTPLPAKKIAYPVTVTIRMPEKWEKQQVVFRLGADELK